MSKNKQKGPMQPPPSPAIKHFLEAGERGTGPMLRPGELACRDLAVTIASRVPELDASMLSGMIEFARLAHADRQRARALIGG
jgi:hypothetical protein